MERDANHRGDTSIPLNYVSSEEARRPIRRPAYERRLVGSLRVRRAHSSLAESRAPPTIRQLSIYSHVLRGGETGLAPTSYSFWRLAHLEDATADARCILIAWRVTCVWRGRHRLSPFSCDLCSDRGNMNITTRIARVVQTTILFGVFCQKTISCDKFSAAPAGAYVYTRDRRPRPQTTMPDDKCDTCGVSARGHRTRRYAFKRDIPLMLVRARLSACGWARAWLSRRAASACLAASSAGPTSCLELRGRL